MKYFSAVVLILFSIFAFGQNRFVGVKSGSLQTYHEEFPRVKKMTSTMFGVSYEHILKKHFSFSADLIYNKRGFKHKGYYYSGGSGGGVLLDWEASGTKARFKHNYISLPIKAGLTTSGRIFIFGSGGLVSSFLVHSSITYPVFASSGWVDRIETVNNTNKSSRFDFGWMCELGWGLRIKTLSFYNTFALQRSWTKVKSESVHIKDANTWHWGYGDAPDITYEMKAITVGVKYNLPK